MYSISTESLARDISCKILTLFTSESPPVDGPLLLPAAMQSHQDSQGRSYNSREALRCHASDLLENDIQVMNEVIALAGIADSLEDFETIS